MALARLGESRARHSTASAAAAAASPLQDSSEVCYFHCTVPLFSAVLALRAFSCDRGSPLRRPLSFPPNSQVLRNLQEPLPLSGSGHSSPPSTYTHLPFSLPFFSLLWPFLTIRLYSPKTCVQYKCPLRTSRPQKSRAYTHTGIHRLHDNKQATRKYSQDG